MKKGVGYTALLLLIVGAFLAGSWYGNGGGVQAGTSNTHPPLYYHCPMHPSFRSDRPGDAPCCGMKLTPVYAEGEGDAGSSEHHGSPAGTVNVNPGIQQILGVKVTPVERASVTATLHLFGRVVPDERLVYRINAGAEGFIREISAVTTGDQVTKGQLLATFSAPNLQALVQTFINHLGAADTIKRSLAAGSIEGQAAPAAASNLQVRMDQLENLGMSAAQMEEIARTRQVPQSVKILAPAGGFVVSRNFFEGQKFDRGEELCRIADLSRVWILADAFGKEAEYLSAGTAVKVSLREQHRSFHAKVSRVLPQFDPATRTLKVRIEVENKNLVLRPDMFVDVEAPVSLPPSITVPADAVVDTGLKKTVFVEQGHGSFKPRMVETGWRFGNHIEIISGLDPAERVVVSGNFLIDSESRMKLQAESHTHPSARTQETAKDLVCGMDVDPEAPDTLTSEHQGKKYYFCCDSCQKTFDADPRKFAQKH